MIPTAKEFSKNYTKLRSAVALKDLSDFAIKFASLHIEAALEAVKNNINLKIENDCYGTTFSKSFGSTEREQGFSSHTSVSVNTDSILNTYPLSNIK
jgi:hypothetical protein